MIRRLCIALFITGMFAASLNAQGTSEPSLISAPQPVYPQDAKEAGIGGTISVEVTVDETGRVAKVGDMNGPAALCRGSRNDPRLVAMRKAVADAIKEAKFYPGTKDGKPVRATVWANMSFDPFGGTDNSAQKKPVHVGVVNGRAIRMPKPAYPAEARASRAGGAVSVGIVIDEKGEVFTAQAVSGHPLLRSSAVDAACDAKFSPTEIDGKPVRIAGVVTYNFFPGR